MLMLARQNEMERLFRDTRLRMRRVATWPRQTGEMGGIVLNKVARNDDDILKK